MYQRFFAILFFAGIALCPAFAQTVTNTILNVDYESGTTNSGISGITATHATAADAAFMVQPGAGSNWAIAHKIAYGDSAYYSDGSWRSEADAIAYLPARFQPGDERRYEFSILLKDWTPWVSGAIHETNIFQLKVSGNSESDSGVPLQLRVARNALRLRYVNSSKVYNFLADVRPYYNQWIHFRIDAKWTLDATGYIKTYMKLPGQSDFTMVDDSTGYNTFAGDPGIGNVGYIKWGLYGIQEGLTHTVYHDDVRIFELNNASTPIAIWNNPVTDNNPAYQTGAYSPTNDVVAANVVNNSTSPSSDFSRTTLTPAGGATLSGRYLLGSWVAGTTTTPSPFDATEYYEFKIAPEAGYRLTLSNMTFYWRTGGATHPNTYVLRSSIDNFTSNISAPVTVSDDAANTSNFGNTTSFDLADISTTGDITLRMYWYGATASGGLVGIDNFAFNGTVFPVSLPASFGQINAVFKNNALLVNWQSLSETNNGHFEIQASKDGQQFTTIKTIPSKNGNSPQPQHYEATIAATDMAAMISVPLLLGLLGWGIKGSRNKIILFSVLIVFTGLAISCNKYNDALLTGGDKLFLRIKQVDLNGKASYSKIIKVIAG